MLRMEGLGKSASIQLSNGLSDIIVDQTTGDNGYVFSFSFLILFNIIEFMQSYGSSLIICADICVVIQC